eukprot:TRINITY_DN14181_c0_g1_i1.p1 TRINITY_DN14181_c0_g1~~TRINITY_DN14181_c0_g1_i1.p1  ORF type:complete len:446 (-),score=103.68 TRINITY_DN14181_c0_g1_i1:56-1393(-)
MDFLFSSSNPSNHISSKDKFLIRGGFLNVDDMPKSDEYELTMDIDDKKVNTKFTRIYQIKISSKILNKNWMIGKTLNDILELQNKITSKKGLLKELLTQKSSSSQKIDSFFKQIVKSELKYDAAFLAFICSDIQANEQIENFTSLNVDLSGFLLKRKGTKRKEAKRWCIIKNRTLYYYKKQTNLLPNGMIPLDGAAAAIRLSNNKTPKNSFRLLSKKGKSADYTFLASNPQEAQTWVEAISKVNNEYQKFNTKVQRVISININSARDVTLPKSNESAEIFAIIFINKRQFSTTTQALTNPKWVTSFSGMTLFKAPVLNQSDQIWITFWNGKKTSAKPTFLGQCMVPASNLSYLTLTDLEIPLVQRSSKEKSSGIIRLSVKYEWYWDKTDIKSDESTRIFGVPIETLLEREKKEYPIPSFFILLLTYFFVERRGDEEGGHFLEACE